MSRKFSGLSYKVVMTVMTAIMMMAGKESTYLWLSGSDMVETLSRKSTQSGS